MLVPVGILGVLAAIGGLMSIAGVWHPFTHWIGETAEALVEPSVAQEYVTSAIAVALGIIGMGVAHRAFREGREIVAGGTPAWRALTSKLWFDEAYEALFEKPAQAAATNLRTLFEGPVVHRSLDEIGRGAQEASTVVGRAQTGLLRSYALAIAATVVVLAVVFLVVR
jgi:NADH:ubiquinone oxidoreductase subunit 5 (subunit L)/multisubunit Na+/H+ antiporter MnhA subunit